jgi:hypothetical protein
MDITQFAGTNELDDKNVFKFLSPCDRVPWCKPSNCSVIMISASGGNSTQTASYLIPAQFCPESLWVTVGKSGDPTIIGLVPIANSAGGYLIYATGNTTAPLGGWFGLFGTIAGAAGPGFVVISVW